MERRELHTQKNRPRRQRKHKIRFRMRAREKRSGEKQGTGTNFLLDLVNVFIRLAAVRICYFFRFSFCRRGDCCRSRITVCGRMCVLARVCVCFWGVIFGAFHWADAERWTNSLHRVYFIRWTAFAPQATTTMRVNVSRCVKNEIVIPTCTCRLGEDGTCCTVHAILPMINRLGEICKTATQQAKTFR